MHERATDELTPPSNLRPAQLGFVLLGKIIVGHFAATLADLAHRGFVSLENVAGNGAQDWLVTDLRGRQSTSDVLLPFERELLHGLFAGHADLYVQRLGPELVPVLNRVRRLLRRDAVRHGWLGRLRRGHRTPRGEQLLAEIKDFRRQLRVLAASGGLASRPDLEAYAIVLGLAAPAATLVRAEESKPAARPDPCVPAARLNGFVTQWGQVCDQLPDHLGHNSQSGDFIHQWSAPPRSHATSHDHASGSSALGSYGGYTHGGHGGGFAAGGHGH
jgi:hypothetical protein